MYTCDYWTTALNNYGPTDRRIWRTRTYSTLIFDKMLRHSREDDNVSSGVMRMMTERWRREFVIAVPPPVVQYCTIRYLSRLSV